MIAAIIVFGFCLVLFGTAGAIVRRSQYIEDTRMKMFTLELEFRRFYIESQIKNLELVTKAQAGITFPDSLMHGRQNQNTH